MKKKKKTVSKYKKNYDSKSTNHIIVMDNLWYSCFLSACNKITKRLNGKWCNGRKYADESITSDHVITIEYSCFVHLAIIKNVHCFVKHRNMLIFLVMKNGNMLWKWLAISWALRSCAHFGYVNQTNFHRRLNSVKSRAWKFSREFSSDTNVFFFFIFWNINTICFFFFFLLSSRNNVYKNSIIHITMSAMLRGFSFELLRQMICTHLFWKALN